MGPTVIKGGFLDTVQAIVKTQWNRACDGVTDLLLTQLGFACNCKCRRLSNGYDSVPSHMFLQGLKILNSRALQRYG